ncbi:RNA--NAD 2'-phosphotransferase, partial [Candidatus Bathyarchaeota archaeon]
EPVILEIDAEAARKNKIRFYKATEKVYLCKYVPPKYIQCLTNKERK